MKKNKDGVAEQVSEKLVEAEITAMFSVPETKCGEVSTQGCKHVNLLVTTKLAEITQTLPRATFSLGYENMNI